MRKGAPVTEYKGCRDLTTPGGAGRQTEGDGIYMTIQKNDLAIPQSMISEIKEIMTAARQNVATQVNNELVSAYWNIGRVIVEHEQKSNQRAEYGKDTMRQLSKMLTKEFGKGFSLSSVYNMRQLYVDYPKFQSLTGKLTWTHYCELMSISDMEKRSFYEKECARSGWSFQKWILSCGLLRHR